jgi:aspartate/methionine/tyrosine aminotransferase
MEQVRRATNTNSSATKFLILNEPYNPAGTLMSRETQAELVEFADRNDIVVLCDEVYRLLEHTDADGGGGDDAAAGTNVRLPAMCDTYRRGISCSTLSKAWGGCGIAVGWLACSDLAMVQQLVDVQYFGCACPSRASELQAILTLRAGAPILHRNLRVVRANLDRLTRFLHTYSEWFDWVPPSAGAIAFVRFKGPMSSSELGLMLASKASVSIKPAYCFTGGVAPPDVEDYFRVGFGEEIMPKALDAFATFVEEHQDEWRAIMASGTTDSI